ncbi:MAG TPA: cell division protein SepF [Natronosporangium sp.]|nr:cell division protein SepF [Natronosporangium sp.]
MGVMRRAGVWLGLVEDDEGYDETGAGEWGDPPPRERARGRRRYRDDYHEDDDGADFPPHRAAEPRSRAPEVDDLPPPSRSLLSQRVAQRRAERDLREREVPREREIPRERDNVRPITRDSNVSYLTDENLALAPRVHAPERPVVVPEEERRYQITTLHPTSFRDARTIGEHFREGTPVIMDLTEMDEADARRLVDFGAGLALGLRGTMERVTNRVFLLSPANVQVTAEDKAKIADGDFFPQR